MQKQVEEKTVIEDGKHEGTILRVDYRTVPFDYVDVIIQYEGLEMKAGYPFMIMPDSLLGERLKAFGCDMKIGDMIDPDDYFIKGTIVEFITMKKTSQKNGKEYANIIPQSLKPKKLAGDEDK